MTKSTGRCKNGHMRYRTFGQTGLEVSELVFGCGAVGGLMINATDDERQDAFDLALASGINWFDTAASYGQGRSEENLGRLLSTCQSRPHVSTKLTIDTRNADYAAQMESSLTQSLERLQSERVTLLQLHNPIARRGDGRTIGVDEVLRPGGVLEAMEGLRRRGLCEHIGITALGEAGAVIDVIESGRVASAQVYYNLLNASAGTPLPATWPHYSFDGIIDACRRHGVAPMNIRVFSAGVIATDERHGRERPLTAGDTVGSETAKASYVLDRLGVDDDARAQTAIRFALAEARLACVVVGLAEIEHLRRALAAAEAGPLSESVLRAIQDAWSAYRTPGRRPASRPRQQTRR